MAKKKLVVIGGGAAGFFCAVNAARMYPALKVVLIEKTSKLLSKVKVSGGGRCNVTHNCSSIAEMIKCYPRGGTFLKKAFHSFFTSDTIAWFEERGVPLKTETDGRMFPASNNSQTIIHCLLSEASKYDVEIMMNSAVLSAEKIGESWMIHTASKEITADFLCIASGGFPKAGQYDWIKSLGHSVELPVPSLFTFNMPGNAITELMGITVEKISLKISGSKHSISGPILITHWGLSGPSVLKLSAYSARELFEKQYHFSIIINWLPEYNENSMILKLQQLRFDIASQKIMNRNPFQLPTRLWEYMMGVAEIHADTRWADLPAKGQNKLAKIICAQEFNVKGKTTFKEEFVTAGGVHLSEIDAQSMESKIVSGLYFAGEIIDVDGITGGYNFQNAWTTGWIAAQGISKYV